MTQDMTKDMILHTMTKKLVRNWRTRVLSAAYSSALTGALTQRQDLCADELTARRSRAYGSCSTRLRLVVLMLLMMVGVNGAWGQDYSGKYYIASDAIVSNKSTYDENTPANNYYLCPTDGWCYYKATDSYDADGTAYPNPFLTTYKWRDGVNDNKVIWIIEKCPNSSYSNYYYFKQHIEGNRYKYLMLNGKISGTPNNNNAKNRMRVHLEERVEDPDNPTTNALFSITLASSANASSLANEKSVIITPKNTENEDSKCKYLVVNGGNANALTGQSAKSDGPGTTNEKYKWTGGIIGLFYDDNNKQDANAPFYLEKKPTISFSDQNKVRITYFDYADNEVEIRYTTNGDAPTASSTLYEGEFDPPAGTTMIKAIAIENGKESDVTTFNPPVFFGIKYLIQSQGNEWATGSFQGNHYYMIPGDDDNNITKVNTTSMLRPSMQWYFLNAGDNYYYIVNNVNMTRMRYNTTSGIHMDTWDDNNANEFKFQIVESATAGTYNIIPYGVTANNKYLNKASGNTSENALILNNSATDANSRWKFVPQDTPLADTPPFTPSGAGTSVYYKIQNGNGTTYHLTPPASADGNATASNASDDATVKSMSWYFTQVEAPTTTDWLAYYKIINAGTGKALYYANTANNSPCLKVGDYNGNNDDYKFAFVKSPTADYYYIVPKSHKDDQLNKISTFYRDGTNIKPATTRAATGNVWTFTTADLFCNDPKFVEEDGKIKIKCNTNVAKIYINTESDANPTDGSTLYDPTQVSWTTNDQVRVKAIAIVSDGTNTVSSAVITLLNKPDVTLAGGPYGYKAAAWEPSVTVSIGEDGNATTAASGTYTTAYANNINAGTANITITDADDTDDLYIWNVPVTEFTIDRVPLTIKAEDKSIGYGDEPDNAGVTYVGFVGNPVETATVLGGTLSYSYTTSGDDPHPYTPYDAQYGNQGTYVITPSGLTSTNYNITFISGTLTVTGKSIGDGSLASGFTLSFDESGEVILKYGTHTLTKNEDYTIGDEILGTKYSSKTISGTGNYTGFLAIRNAFVHFTTDASQVEWSATFVAERSGVNDIGHALPDGISAYIISAIEGDWAIPEPLDYIPADVPVLLVAHEEKNGFLVKDANSESVTVITDAQKGYNKLKEVTVESAHFNTKQIYVLYNNEFVLNKEGDLGRGKVYMENPYYSGAVSPAPARLIISRVKGNVTGIKDIQKYGTTELGNERWYTIDGRRLSGKPNAKGLYIVNGKKKVVK